MSGRSPAASLGGWRDVNRDLLLLLGATSMAVVAFGLKTLASFSVRIHVGYYKSFESLNFFAKPKSDCSFLQFISDQRACCYFGPRRNCRGKMFGSTNPFGQSSNSLFGSQSVFGQTNNASSNPFAPKPFGSTTPFGSQTGGSIFGGTSTGVFGGTQSSAPLTSKPAFGVSPSPAFGSSAPAFGASSTPAFGSSSSSFGSSSVFGQKPAFGGFGSSTPQTNPFGGTSQQSQPAFGSSLFGSTPFGASSQPAFGTSSTPAFGSTSTSTFGATSSPAFGATSTPAFGSTASPAFGSTGTAFGVSNASVFGSGGAFAASSTPVFGSSSTQAFGASSTPAFGASSSPAFGVSSTPAFGAQATTPTFGSPDFGQAAFGGQHGGTRVAAFTPTTELDSGTGTEPAGKLESISAMPVYKDKSHEELKWEDYQLGDKGGPAPAGQSTGATGFGATPTQSNPFASSSAFGQSSANPFSSSTPSNPFAKKTPAFGSTGFGSSSTAFNSSPFGASSTSNPFGSTSSGTSSIFGASGSAFGTNTSPSLFGLASSPAFGTSTSIFGSASAPGTASAFGYGLSFANTPTFSSPGLGQAAFGGQHGGTRVAAYTPTSELDIGTGTQLAEKLESISAMPVYKDKSLEELRWEDYQLVDKGGPAPAGQSTGAIGIGATPTQSNPFASSSAFGQSFANPFSSSTHSNPFAQKTPTFGSTGFGSSSAAFNSSPFGASSTSNPFGSTSFGTSSIFGVSGSAFGINTSPSLFGSTSSPAFGTSTSIFGSASAPGTASPFGCGLSFANSPTFGSPGLGQAAFGGQRGGTRVAAYTPTVELDIGTGTQLAEKLESISAMPVYKDKSHEELKWEDYQLGDKGGPAPAAQSTGATGFGAAPKQSNPFASSSAFGQSSANPFSSSTPSNPFAKKTPAFGSTGFGSSSAAFNSSPFSASSTSNPFGSTSSGTSSIFGASNTSPSLFGSASSPAFGTSTSIFGSASAPRTASPFGCGLSFANTPTFGCPGLGQAAFGSQRGGTRVAAYTPTAELDIGTGTQLAEKLESISAMPVYKDKSHEELKWEDYQLGDKGGPASAGQSTGATGFGAAPTQSNPFTSSSAFGQSSANRFSSSTPSNPFAQKTLAFGSTGFGSSSAAFDSSPCGASSTSNPFGSTSSGTSSIFGASGSAFRTNTSPSLFGSASSPAFGISTSIFCSASAPGTASPFGYGLSFANTPTFGSPSLGQAAFEGQHGGTRVAAYTPTAELEIGTGTQLAESLESISAMPVYKDKSHEELRWEDYQLGDKGGPAPAGQSTGATGFGAVPKQSNPFASSSAFGQSSANSFSSSTPSNPFAQKPPAFGSTSFGSSSTAFNSSPFGALSASNPFGSISSRTFSIFGASAPETASPFGYGLSFANIPTFGSPGFGQAAFGGQRGGTRVAAYTPTVELDSGTGTQPAGKLESISAMPVYKDKSHEELKWEDYQLGDKGGPASVLHQLQEQLQRLVLGQLVLKSPLSPLNVAVILVVVAGKEVDDRLRSLKDGGGYRFNLGAVAIETLRQQDMENNPPILEEVHEVDINQVRNANAEALQAIRDGQQMMQQGQV
ncbi:hypothetical protein Vadar_003473 [Vaccinium darrowii]|uniref:Uncharacterized protein n=1 Tax=Vaccinium darrowii TaxID=229202 RepID=A0ACB7WXQ5_9ERIC|nr:hypothetical protein Vadar_003473 [Vaccinium darrowii]